MHARMLLLQVLQWAFGCEDGLEAAFPPGLPASFASVHMGAAWGCPKHAEDSGKGA
jgi:hypothetical protein